MNLLDRYLFKSVLATCLAAMGLFAFVLMLGNAIRDVLGPLMAGQLPVMVFVELILLLIPFVVSYALPMGMLTGVLLTLGRLSSDSEVTAMRAAGLSLQRIARPVILLGVAGALAGLYVNYEAMPWARVEYHRVFAAAMRADPLSFIQPRTFIRSFQGYVVYVGEKEGSILRDIWIWELDKERRVRRLVRADSGRIEFDEASNSLIPTLVHAKSEERDARNPEDFSRSPRAPSVEKAEDLRLSLDGYFKPVGVNVKPEWLGLRALQARRAEVAALPPPPKGGEKERARTVLKLAFIFHEKANLSLAVLTFVLVGVPLGIKVSRRETSANLGVALALVLGYYLLTVMVKWLDRHPEYHPELLLWLPNLLFLAVGVWLFRRIQRN